MKEDINYTEYDLTHFYKTEIEPKVIEIKKLCRVNKLPFAFVAALKNANGKTEYKSEANLTGSNGINLYDDHFENYLMALNGFDLTPVAGLEEFDDNLISGGAMDYIQNAPNDNEESLVMGIVDVGDI